MPSGEVKIVSTKVAPKVRTEGPHIDRFLAKLKKKHGELTAKRTHDVAIDVVARCVETYGEVFRVGEVGADGSGAVHQPVGGTKCPCVEGTPDVDGLPNSTGLLYGKVQSGKTNGSMATVALALENGFRCFVVLTSDNTLLGEQTFDRFVEELEGGPTIIPWTDWETDPEEFGKSLKQQDRINDGGIIFVSTKNTHHLRKLCQVLWFAGARFFPAMLLDDEADNASLNTNASKKDKDESSPGAIFSRIGQIRKTLGNHIYLQVTATPQSLFLQAVDHPCKPKFCVRLPPGEQYVGGDYFFAENTKLQVELPDEEFDNLRDDAPSGKREAPDGLRLALAAFLVGCAEHHADDSGIDRFAFLAHVDMRQIKHNELRAVIDGFVLELSRALRGKESDAKKREAEHLIERARVELKRTRAELKPIAAHKEYIASRGGNLRTVVINSEKGDAKKITLRAGPNIFVGGNRLGRGLTIDNLTVTYYGRDAKTKMMDVVHQHARMFGYRKRLLDVTRLFSTKDILSAFKSIHDADEAMRRALGDDPTQIHLQPVWVGPLMRPTRSNVLDPTQLGVMVPGRPYYPWAPDDDRKRLEQLNPKIDALLAGKKEQSFVPVSLTFLKELLVHLPAEAHTGHAWTDERVQVVLDELMRRGYGHTDGHLHFTRTYSRKDGGRVVRTVGEPTDFIYTKDIKAVDPSKVTLLLRYQQGLKEDGWKGAPFWAPTLVLPTDVKPQPFVFMYNLVGRE